MSGASMNDIKARMKSVQSTMQITKAMELVATSKLRKAKELTANVGLVLKLKDDEISAILNGGDYEDAVFTALDDGRYDWDGTLSISESDVAQFNRRYNTNYSCNGHNIPL